MNRPLRVFLLTMAAVGLAVAASACGTQRISLPKSDPSHAQDTAAAHLFAQRCAGCHSLSYAGTRGSAANPRTAEAINGPNFNVRCERPVTRVLYAIENGGFSGAYMPQNVFVGQQAREVAEFVARFAGRQAPKEPDSPSCQSQPIGTLPPLPTGNTLASTGGTTTSAGAGTTTTGTSTSSTKPASSSKRGKAHRKSKKK